jgi:hypothetical protein
VPGLGMGGNGSASEFGTLTGMTRQEVDAFLRGLGAEVKVTIGGYIEYKFADRSKVVIRPDGEVVRLPAPRYDEQGKNINKGLRLSQTGAILPTRDEFGNMRFGTHNTGEKVDD